ncbi:MAG: murein biosynthesis integral membrane protein MurJ [Armatimonadota bacterium]
MTSHKTVTKAAGIMMVAIFASRLLGLIRDLLISREFGLSGLVSAYTVAFNLPDLLYFFLSSGALSGAFIPVFTERFQTGRKTEAWQIFSIIACFMVLVLLTVIAISEIFTDPLVRILAAPGFAANEPELVPLVVKLTRIILPCQLFFFLGGLMMGTLESRQMFAARAAGPVIYNLGIIFGVVVLSRWISIEGLAWGAMIGAFAGNIGYTFYCMKKAGFEFHPSLNIFHHGVVQVGKLALPVILGLSLPQIDIIINRWFATFVSDIAPGALNYANRLMQVPLGVFAQAAGTAILPTLSALAARKAIDELRSSLSFGLRAVLALNIPASLFMVVMADPIVRTVFMTPGGEFKHSDVPATEIGVIMYCVGIFAWAGQAIVARGFFAMQDTITPVVLGSVVTIFFIPMNFIFMKMFGHGGLALATSVAATIHLLGLILFIRKKTGGIEGARVIKSTTKIIIAAFVMAICCYGVRVGVSNTIGSWNVLDGDIKNPVAFIQLINASKDNTSLKLKNNLSKDTITAFDSKIKLQRLEKDLKIIVRDNFNEIIANDNLNKPEIIESLILSSKTKRLLTAKPNDRKYLNRLIIEDAYAPKIRRISDRSSYFTKIMMEKPEKDLSDEKSPLIDETEIHNLYALLSVIFAPDKNIDERNTLKLSNHIKTTSFSEKDQELVKQFFSEYINAEKLPDLLNNDINAVISKYDLSNSNSSLEGKKLIKSNRIILQALYEKEIKHRSIHLVESWSGAVLSLLISMFIASIVYLLVLRLLKSEEYSFVSDSIKRRLNKS